MSTPQFPHAALLIDFDNVTMGIRSDLSKELKVLLSSDFIKGKVAVQRAYADWRRYPQYIVPLAESSVDLIFAPAYGSSKKNATDIRLAIDALELVFTRPEIGTYILLSGDSDFSSLVLKLKEYGKYVVGVGIRESASDLLVQNCDEYYSYSALTGLTRAGDEPAATSEDPWELVELAIKQMVDNSDVMRSDRLKQVILEMDPNFDEKALGFQKFNRFMQEAAGRGLVSLRKLENGQYEVGLPGALGEPAPTDEEAASQANGRRRSRRGRGRDRERERERGQPEPEEARSEAQAVETPPAESLPGTEPPAEQQPPSAPSATAPADVKEGAEELAAPVADGDQLRAAYNLLRRAIGDVAGRSGAGARDSDIKRRILELEETWDEARLGFSKFSRFLRQAHDADVINLRRLENGVYEAALAAGVETATAPPAAPRGRGRRERGRGGRATDRATREEIVDEKADATPAPASRPGKADSAEKPATSTPPAATSQAAAPTPVPPAAKPSATQAPGRAAGRGIGMRRGSRGRSPGAAPPPLLEGQTVPRAAITSATPSSDLPPAVTEADAAPAKPGPAPAGRKRAPAATRRGALRKRGAGKTEPPASPPATSRSAPASPTFEELGLPADAGAVVNYLRQYEGVGPKSVQSLVAAFGAGSVFEALRDQPDRVREVVTGARGERLLEAWNRDYQRRLKSQKRKAPGSRSRRGGRGSGRTRQQ